MSEPWIQTFGGIEVCETMGNNPDDPPEQHATGEPTVWWRFNNSEWILVNMSIEEVRERCRDCGRSFAEFYMLLWRLDRQKRANRKATLNSSGVKDSLTTEAEGGQ